MDRDFVLHDVVAYVEENSRKIDALRIKNLFKNQDREILDELVRYQNSDGGFGNALEPDVRMPQSSVVATDVAVTILEEVRDESLKEKLVKDVVGYYESVYRKDIERFVMVDENVDLYPHAVWWNYDKVLENFPFGNPDPEVIGFLFKYRKYLKQLNINHLINKVIDYIMGDFREECSMHQLLSVLVFYDRVDNDVKNLIKPVLIEVVNKTVEEDKGKWDSYCLEPYKIAAHSKEFLSNSDVVDESIAYRYKQVEEFKIDVTWSWYQFEDVFEKVKRDWIGSIYLEVLKAKFQ